MASFKFILLIVAMLAVAGALFRKREDLGRFFGEVRAEMGKVSWPQADEVINSTILIFVVTIAVALLCLVTDSIFASILKAFYHK